MVITYSNNKSHLVTMINGEVVETIGNPTYKLGSPKYSLNTCSDKNLAYHIDYKESFNVIEIPLKKNCSNIELLHTFNTKLDNNHIKVIINDAMGYTVNFFNMVLANDISITDDGNEDDQPIIVIFMGIVQFPKEE